MNSSPISESTISALSPMQPASRREHVKFVFENVSHYLASRSVDIRIRRETVSTFARLFPAAQDILDAGCGDGSITLPMLTPGKSLTWMDLSASMLASAASKVPGPLTNLVQLRNEDVLLADFGQQRFDLIVSVGVIAHVEDPALFLAKLRSLLRPGGHLILEFTDAMHPVGRLGRFWGMLKERLAPARYQTNKLSAKTLYRLFKEQGFHLATEYRYSRLPLPGVDRFLSERLHYKICRFLFGDVARNTWAKLGNEHICLLAAN